MNKKTSLPKIYQKAIKVNRLNQEIINNNFLITNAKIFGGIKSINKEKLKKDNEEIKEKIDKLKKEVDKMLK